MSYLVAFHWGWLIGALLIGLGMGWIAVVQHGEGLSKMAMRRIAAVVVVLAAVAIARLIPGRPGYWLDLALIMLAVYLIGCAIGSWLRDWFISRHPPSPV